MYRSHEERKEAKIGIDEKRDREWTGGAFG